MNKSTIKKAIFPVGGLGTRFLPATKAIPKEMLPVAGKPLIQYAVEEAIEAGIDTIIFVTGRNKRAIEDHFDTAYELEDILEKKGKSKQLELVQNIIPPHITVVYIRQGEALGLGHAILKAKDVIGDEHFAILLADDLIKADDKSCLAQMTEVYDKTVSSVIAVQQVPKERTDQYGVVKTERLSGLCEINQIVEKPSPEEAPSNLGVVGRYILSPKIFHFLENIKKGAGGEYQLTDAISELLKEETINALSFEGTRYDCGDKNGYLQANIEYTDEELMQS